MSENYQDVRRIWNRFNNYDKQILSLQQNLLSLSQNTGALNTGSSNNSIQNHMNNELIHFSESSIDHVNIQSIGTNTHAQIDTHISDSTLHFLEGAIDHTAILNIGTNAHSVIDTHLADGTKHFLEGAIDHTAILNIGTNAHSVIDTHLASTSNPHSVTKAQVSLTNVTDDAQIAKSIGTTKGDIIGFTASATPLRLAVGTDAQVLTADSAEVTGLKWVAAGAAPVDSVFTRTGAVVAATNDYTWAQINKATSSIADITTRSHTALSDIGTNAHSVIDTHLLNEPAAAIATHAAITTAHHTKYTDANAVDAIEAVGEAVAVAGDYLVYIDSGVLKKDTITDILALGVQATSILPIHRQGQLGCAEQMISASAWLGIGMYFPNADTDCRAQWEFQIPSNIPAGSTTSLRIIYQRWGSSGTYSGKWEVSAHGATETPTSNNILNNDTTNDFTHPGSTDTLRSKTISLGTTAVAGDNVQVRFTSDASNSNVLIINTIWLEIS